MLSDRLIKDQEARGLVSASVLFSTLTPVVSEFGIAIKSINGLYEQASRGLELMLSLSAEQIVGKRDSDLFSAEIAERLEITDQRIMEGQSVACEEIRIPEGACMPPIQWVKFPVLGVDGTICAIGLIVLGTRTQEELNGMRCSIEQLKFSNALLQKKLVEAEQQASTDRLTGTWNRCRLEETIVSEMERFRRYGHPLCLLIIDVDSFKKVNDQHGHLVGDEVLAVLAKTIQSTLRVTDSLTRWGGEEFVVLSPGTNLSAMLLLAERLRERVARTAFRSVKTITVSIGVAECLRSETWESWFQRADAALYRAKACGRNQVQHAQGSEWQLNVAESIPQGYSDLVWHSAYDSGDEFLDEQHHGLFTLVNNSLSAILEQRPREEIEALIDRLIRDTAQHFEDEEALLEEICYPGLAEHAFKHASLIDAAVQLAVRFHSSVAHAGELFLFLAHEVVARHLLSDDREFFPFLQQAARTPRPLWAEKCRT